MQDLLPKNPNYARICKKNHGLGTGRCTQAVVCSQIHIPVILPQDVPEEGDGQNGVGGDPGHGVRRIGLSATVLLFVLFYRKLFAITFDAASLLGMASLSF